MNAPARFTVPDPALCGTAETSEKSMRWLRLLLGTLVILGLFGWQTWMTLGLFGDPAWTNLTSDAASHVG